MALLPVNVDIKALTKIHSPTRMASGGTGADVK